jgi:hypothetical protein
MNLNDSITCEWCQDHIESYLDGELTDEESLCLNGRGGPSEGTMHSTDIWWICGDISH